MILLNNNVNNFSVFTDSLQLQQINELPTLRLNSGTMLHTGSHHYITISCVNKMILCCYDNLNHFTLTEQTLQNLKQLKPVTEQNEVGCGGMAAFLTSCAFGVDPSDFDFNVALIRARMTR